MSAQYHTKNGRTSKRGAFMNGIWHCDCEPRMPAEKFQTKNGGKNHGRWFFTCQKPQPKRCSFFLWSDDAKVREEAAVLNNSRSEPDLPAAPQTPRKQPPSLQPPTPISVTRMEALSTTKHTITPPRPHTPTQRDSNETFDWSSSGDEDLVAIAEAASNDIESPSKAARTNIYDSPTKRRHSEMISSNDTDSTWPLEEEIFRTPSSSTLSNGLLSPKSAHTNHQQQPPLNQSSPHDQAQTIQPPITSSNDLTTSVLALLKPTITLPPSLETELITLLSRHDLRTQGIIRGRDITRIAVQTKDKKIAELQSRISALEADRETTRTVIAHLKQDIATSPKRPGRRSHGMQQQQQQQRSNV